VKAMLLAAGLGERMRPLTDHTPKPLLRVAGIPLLEHHIRRLVLAGFSDLLINVSHLSEQIVQYFGSGENWGASIFWSCEDAPLETAGGIINVLDQLGDQPFLVVNGDIWTDYPFEQLRESRLQNPACAYLVMVKNPAAHSGGDFTLAEDGVLGFKNAGDCALTYSGLGVYCAEFFAGVPAGKTPLRPLLDRAIRQGRLSGEFYSGQWVDVGTPERLAQLNAHLAGSCEDL
jgi:N-acetyl-alpha-D-muramate 1-phosphate uridylyltransferase